MRQNTVLNSREQAVQDEQASRSDTLRALEDKYSLVDKGLEHGIGDGFVSHSNYAWLHYAGPVVEKQLLLLPVELTH